MSSTTPTPPSPPPPAVSLTERRKAETRMEIARAAAGLFVRQGLRATRAEDIAQAAGIAPRTFYRYFASKEEAIGPLYATGAQRWVAAVRAAPAEVPLPQVLEDAVRHTLTPGLGVSAASWDWVRTLIRLAEANPALRRVWAEACRASERSLAEALAERLTAAQAPYDADNVAARTRLCFTAAVASAAVRTAMESWAAGDGPAEGPRGPAELAVTNLAALRGFAWGT
ncbi:MULTISPECIES: TetR/AcrR family transcriptional regulator [unclassified Streptomyces]|uniref:TetR/AcrR family transcriptional regulator n=1 Tax=unclassified Streptomyces TaxID=2593676 RepID=UPI00093BB817|nr:TetR family transcriptional regulator [Streptomyces sp. CB02400]OKJ99188.1 TetR family transcriptional regulator [Streptomyces sp. CB02400]